jgi:SAM-dependent methyltransferase
MSFNDAPAASTYSSGVLSHRRQGEYERLRLLEQLCDPVTTQIIATLDIGRQGRCLEIGAGSGSVARWLASHRPEGHVIATELDTGFLEASPRPANLEIRRHDVTCEDFPAHSQDLVHARALLTHLGDPERVLERMASWLVPGGWLVVEDPTYFPPESSPHPDFAALLHAGERLLAQIQGTDQTWARRIPAAMARSGLTDIRMSVRVAVCGGNETEDAFWRACFAQATPALVERGLLTESQIARGLAHLDDPTFTDVTWQVVSCWGRRPRLS